MPVFFYSVQPLKGQLGFEEIDAIKTSCTISSVSSVIWARLKSMKHATSTRIWTWSIIPPKYSMFGYVQQRNIISAVDRICPLWKFECRHRRQDNNLSRQNLSFDFVKTIPVFPLVRIGPYCDAFFLLWQLFLTATHFSNCATIFSVLQIFQHVTRFSSCDPII